MVTYPHIFFMDNNAFKNDLGLFTLPALYKWRKKYKDDNIGNLNSFGTCVFCGPQGSGKTLSAVQYVENLFLFCPRSILVTNVNLKTYPVNSYWDYENNCLKYIDSSIVITEDYITEHWQDDNYIKPVVQYEGVDMLTELKNGVYGIIYLIDEFHLEFNSLESKNIPIEVMTEISQQRKQRVHIVGTSQVFMRLAKPIREQMFNVIVCRNYFGILQINKMSLGEEMKENKDGKIEAPVKSRSIFFHQPKYYEEYDTFAKMKRYSKLWKNNSKGGLNSIYE